jgi:hypothetical protein
MKRELLEIIQRSRFKNSWSTSPGRDNVDLKTPQGDWIIRIWSDQQKIKVTRKGTMRNLLGLSKGRWQSLADFEVWLQDQEAHLGESKFPKFRQFCLKEENDEKGAFILPEEVFEQLFPHFNNKFGGIIDLDNDLGPMLGAGDVNIRTPSLWKTTREHPVQQVKGDTILSLWYTTHVSGLVVRGVWKPSDIEELPEVDWIREQGFVQLKYRTTSWEKVRDWWAAKASGPEVQEWWATNS